jgi:hypothetical protein
LEGSLAQLKLAMHLHDWKQMLADTRVQLFAGDQAVRQLYEQMIAHPSASWPMSAINVDLTLWKDFKTLDELRQRASDTCGKELETIAKTIQSNPPGPIAEGRRLTVLGLTSRYTSFLQHSMRDWLAAFEELGHSTFTLIEHADHEVLTSLDQARAVAKHNPDVLLMIDHYRGEFRNLPADRPTVCWVQDRMPHLFRKSAGQAQAATDFAMGYAQAELVGQFGWPAERFMSCVIPVNEKRFAVESISREQSARYGCDVSFVSHASKTPEELRDAEISQAKDLPHREAIDAISQRLFHVYSQGNSITGDGPLTAMVKATLRDIGSSISDITPLLDYARLRLNNALFRHQALEWTSEICRERGLHFALWGKGWDQHPRLKQHAMGEADNQSDLKFIYHASKINLQLSPFTSAHQRSFEALCADGFLLCRRTNRDDFDRVHRELFLHGSKLGITCNDDLRISRDDRLWELVKQSADAFGVHPLDQPGDFWKSLAAQDDAQWTEAGSTLWPEQFDGVSFSTKQELVAMISACHRRDDWRAEVTQVMKQVVNDKVTYRAVTERLLGRLLGRLSN